MPSIELTDAEWSLITDALRSRMTSAEQSKLFRTRYELLRKICFALRDLLETPESRHARLVGEQVRRDERWQDEWTWKG